MNLSRKAEIYALNISEQMGLGHRGCKVLYALSWSSYAFTTGSDCSWRRKHISWIHMGWLQWPWSLLCWLHRVTRPFLTSLVPHESSLSQCSCSSHSLSVFFFLFHWFICNLTGWWQLWWTQYSFKRQWRASESQHVSKPLSECRKSQSLTLEDEQLDI